VEYRYGSGDIEDGITFGGFLVFLLISSSLLWISALYKWRRHGFYHLPLEVEFPRAPDPPRGPHELCRSVVGLMGSYDCVRRMIVHSFPSLVFSALILAYAAQEVYA